MVVLLTTQGGFNNFLVFHLRKTSWTHLLGSRLILMFHSKLLLLFNIMPNCPTNDNLPSQKIVKDQIKFCQRHGCAINEFGRMPDGYSEPSSASKIELFSFQPLTIFSESSILDVWLGYEYASGCNISFNFPIKWDFLNLRVRVKIICHFPLGHFFIIFFMFFSGALEEVSMGLNKLNWRANKRYFKILKVKGDYQKVVTMIIASLSKYVLNKVNTFYCVNVTMNVFNNL